MSTAVERLAAAIGYPERVPDGATSYTFRVDDDDLSAYVDGGRLVPTQWDTSSARFPATIHVEGIDRLGILQEIIYIISTNLAIDMRSLNIHAEQGVFSCDLDVLIEDTSVIINLCKRLKRVKGVNMATRVNS